ncbi:diacylglycerol/lipid kinase family protein [Flavobacterium caeni]|uniref:Lipid kinase, YegS/Rv2252/BmrU family n=1 Tax=Flavobacterium caeni TaxID=490189 RepID=A0A1G5B7U3_9FLAO|nr:diacylglycerol kinase family protein [Flavobacterium caeni]SCX86294.1 lipid kinase, YegS/Rv2252/BmrU family [Flavobacterium caeni]
MTYLHFIVNPISGNGKHHLGETMLRQFFPESEYRIAVDYTKHKGHAKTLTESIIKLHPDCIVACGGDGTISEVASGLVDSVIKLAIVPVGSGNGLASNLGIPQSVPAALDTIKNGTVAFIDVGKVNQRYFFSNMGIGVDAKIIKRYERTGKRTLSAYIAATLRESFRFAPRQTMLAYNNQIDSQMPFLLFVSNSNEMGYGMSLTPEAKLNDGKLDLLLVPQISLFRKLQLGYSVLSKKTKRFSKSTHTTFTNLVLEQQETIYMDVQIDGEFHNLKTNKLTIDVLHKALRVVVPIV